MWSTSWFRRNPAVSAFRTGKIWSFAPVEGRGMALAVRIDQDGSIEVGWLDGMGAMPELRCDMLVESASQSVPAVWRPCEVTS